MIFESEVDGWQVSQGLVRPAEVVLNEPLGQVPIEGHRIVRHLPHGQEFVLECAVEPFIDSVVLGRLDPRPVVLKTERLTGRVEVPVELAAIVGLDIFDVAVQEEVKA